MPDRVANLGALRADRSEDCRDWSVEECLQDALDRVRRGEFPTDGVLILFRGESTESSATAQISRQRAQLNIDQELGMLELYRGQLVGEWSDG